MPKTNEAMVSRALGPQGTWAPSPAAAPANSAVIRAVPCYVVEVYAANSNAANTYYLQLFDSNAVPAPAAVPRVASIPIGPNQTVIVPIRLDCVNGISWGASTSATNYASAGTSPFQVSALLVP